MNLTQGRAFNIGRKILVQEDNIVGYVDCDLYGDSWTELYLQFKKLHKESYSPGEIIVVRSTYDYYNNEPAGVILQSVQTIVNLVDISNFFIRFETTNESIHKEYQYILQTYSIDNVPFRLCILDGKFNKHQNSTKSPFIKYKHMPDTGMLESFTEDQKRLLFSSESFCIAPWTALNIGTNNNVRPCCEFKGSIGNASEQSLEDIWNNPEIKTIRKKMLTNEKPQECTKCHTKEFYGRDSLRNSLNRSFGSHITKIYNADYSCEYELVYLDARFNNLCNLSCRSCDPEYSSSWHKPAVELGIIAKDTPVFSKAGRHNGDLLDQIKEHVNSIQRIYFAGGEPLIIEEFYQLLEELDRAGRHDVELIYNTNLTKNHLKDRYIIDYWKNFKNITIGASLDAEYTRAEYLRCGTNWEDVIEFRQQILQHRPDIDFYISATTSMINALHVADFHRSWVELQLIEPADFNIQLLFDPAYMSVCNAPDSLKEKIRKKYANHLKWLRPLDKLGRATFGFESLLKHMDKQNSHFDRKLFWNNVNSLDSYHNTDLLAVFPELEDLK